MKKIILIDGNSLMFRAYYATAYSGNLMKNTKGLHTNAIYAMVNMMDKILKMDFTHILVAFDYGKKTFRHEKLESYKDGRKAMPEEFREQIEYIYRLVETLGCKTYKLELYEADDIIGTMSRLAKEKNMHVDIYTSDKDMLQLIDDNVHVQMTKKGVTQIDTYDRNAIKEKYNLRVDQLIDLKALMGDASDNLSGIPGVGEKTAIKLLVEYNDLDGIIKSMDSIKGKLGEKIRDNYNNAILTKEIVTIDQNSPIEVTLEDTKYNGFDSSKLKELYKHLEFNTFLKRMESKKEKDYSLNYVTYNGTQNLDEYLVNNATVVLEYFDRVYNRATPLGFAITVKDKSIFIPFENITNKKLISFIEDANLKKSTCNLKALHNILSRFFVTPRGFDFCFNIASYVADPIKLSDDFRELSEIYSYDNVMFEEEVYGKYGTTKYSIKSMELSAKYAIEKSFCISSIKEEVLSKIKSENQSELFKLEMDIAIILSNMELEGVLIDKDELLKQRENLSLRISELESKIFELAGEEFNISSPKQLGIVLFEKLNLPPVKKTKTGYSTNAEVLNKLEHEHAIISYIKEYRSLTKLFNTYIEGLEYSINSEDGKIHTIFTQTATTTGRLSSIEPNLQNIPIKTEDGRNIRKIFIPTQPNNVLIAADYSQIELRVLSFTANEENLRKAFLSDEDIHTNTAKLIFGKEEIEPLDRRAAKAINFGLIYGKQAWGLSTDLNISVAKAQDFIDSYFESFPGIKNYMDSQIEFAKENLYVKTIMNRKRYVSGINSKIHPVREAEKRAAMNAPVQGSAADIIKLSMVRVYNEIIKNNLKSKMILQVHDELIFDVCENEIEIMKELIVSSMENAIDIKVPLKVEYGLGKNWYELK